MKSIFYLTLIFGSLISCKTDSNNPKLKEPFNEINVIRFEQEIQKLDTNNIESGLTMLIQKYPVFSRIYFQDIMNMVEDIDSPTVEFYADVRNYLSNDLSKIILHKIDSMFGDFSTLKKEFERTAAYAKHYLPKSKAIVIYTMYSGFNVGNIIFSNTDSTDGLGISLDFFLGSDFNYRAINPNLELFSNYLTRTFNRDHLLKKSWTAFADDQVNRENLNTLLDYMIHEGKKLYLLKKIIPDIQDSVLYEFTPEQLIWCKKNQLEIWNFLKEKQLLTSTKAKDINKLLMPAPTTSMMPKESPGRATVFIGLEIIKAYMSKNPETDLQELLNHKNAQKILDDSKYKPRNEE
ncbi:MAG: hypothetical protein IT267_05735 [Saprospiraceae bacterium]|nr:hypothetical protein [Saprospiraceae bacterium]